MRHRFPLNPDDPNYEQHLQSYQAQRRGRALTLGILLLAAGAFTLLRRLRVVPDLHALWPYGLVALAVVIGLRTRFRSAAWWILLVIGLAHAIPPFQVYGELYSNNLVLPIALLAGGAFLLLRRTPKGNEKMATLPDAPLQATPLLDVNTVFGGRKEIITAKDFAGGTVSTVFGGTELNLMQADVQAQTPIVLNLHVLFGGVELLVPAHWTLQNTIAPVFGGLDDRRIFRADAGTPGTAPVLILRGSCVFGGIEIKSY